MEHNILSLDFWQDTVTYEGHTIPTGTIGCAVLNIPDTVIDRLKQLTGPALEFLKTLSAGAPDPALLPAVMESTEKMMVLLHDYPPFDILDLEFYLPFIGRAFTPEGVQQFSAYNLALITNALTPEKMEEYRLGVFLSRILPVLTQLADSLKAYKIGIEPFTKMLDQDDSQRTPDGLAALFGQFYPPEVPFAEPDKWMSMTNTTIQYLSVIRPGEEIAKLVKRIHYVSFVGMFRSDLFEGLCVGHAPKKCRICGKWFLTTNARHTKYCGGFAPGDRLHRTCRQLGNLKGRVQRELAEDHPLKQIYEKRLNTINRYVKRGTLDADLAEAMKKLAKDKMLRALSNVAYAQGDYEKEMGQAALKKEAYDKK